jgi:hypothetical protein
MTKRVIQVRQEDEDRRSRQEESDVDNIVDSESGEEEDKEDDDGVADEKDIWEVTHVTEEDFETTVRVTD